MRAGYSKCSPSESALRGLVRKHCTSQGGGVSVASCPGAWLRSAVRCLAFSHSTRRVESTRIDLHGEGFAPVGEAGAPALAWVLPLSDE